MMTLYSGTSCPFSQRCRIVLYEKGMDFQIVDVDLYNKPEDLAVMNPYNQVPEPVEQRYLRRIRLGNTAQSNLTVRVRGQNHVVRLNARQFFEQRARRVTQPGALLPQLQGLP